MPTRPPSGRLEASQSSRSGQPGVPAFISTHSLPSSWLACRKYRPSVHSRACSWVTTTVPAEPVNFERYSRLLKQSAMYSLMCGSSVGTIYACTPWPPSAWDMAARRADSRSSGTGGTAAGGASMVDREGPVPKPLVPNATVRKLDRLPLISDCCKRMRLDGFWVRRTGGTRPIMCEVCPKATGETALLVERRNAAFISSS
mmetsp:Transcript_12258/g.26444  ORF Transcript_12258/g.26444 Transcript_12258/m.26444 type:complete len:201 (-) Transcript_12258:72-674(-)